MEIKNPLYQNQGIHVIASIFTVEKGIAKVLLIHRKNEPCKCINMREWFQVQEGHYTMARVDQDHGKYSIIVSECDSAEGPYTFGTYMWARFKNLSAIEKRLIEGPYIHHVSEIEGSFTEEIAEVCKYIPALEFDFVG